MADSLRILALFGSAVLHGQERGNIEALAALKEQGCEILCLVRNETWSKLILETLDSRGLSWRKVPYIEHWMPGRLRWVLFRNPIAFIVANLQFLKIIRQFRPTHIHAFNHIFVLNFLIGLILVRIPMIYRAGDVPTIHNWVWRTLWRFIIRRADRFVANSEFVVQSLCSSGVLSDRITVIYNAPPRRSRIAQPLSLSLPPEVRALVFMGLIDEIKGVDLLIDAFRILAKDYSDIWLLVAGRISDWSGDAWGRRLKEYVASDSLISGRVMFLGYVEDVPNLLALCEIHVAPSLVDDASPNVVMEAKLAGKASVVFPRGGLPELIKHNVDGYVCRDASVPALVEALREYLNDASLAPRHGEAAFASLRRLGIPEFSKRWVEIYQSTRHS